MKLFIKVVSTFFFIGYFPAMPGTAASMVGAMLAFMLRDNIFIYIALWGIITFFGFLVSGKMESILGCKDPGCVVIDEVSGVMITFFLLPVRPAVWITAFFLFRAFDMFKIYPCNWIEKKTGSFGIMSDDIVAGFYANAIMHIAIRVIEFL